MDDQPLRVHLQSIHRQTGVMPDQLAEAATLPEGLEGLWRTFLDLHQTRAAGMSGPSRITFSDIDAMQRVTGVTLEPWEVDAIRAADSAYFEFRAS